MSIFITTGEVSGDIYASKLSNALRRILPDQEIWGMAGELAVGVNRVWNNDILHIFGLGRIAKSLPKLFKLRQELAKAVIARQPDVVIVIDSPDFHIPLLSKIRSLGYSGSVVYVCPPTIWAWRSGRAKYLRRYCDLCLPLFRFEEEALERNNVRSYWSGHPLLDDFDGYVPDAPLPEDLKRVAIMPGSRRSELQTLLPVLIKVAELLQAEGLHPVISMAPGLSPQLKKQVEDCASGLDTTDISGRSLMSQSKFVIGACGTTAVEAMLLNKYMIVLYKGTALEWTIFKLLAHTKFVAIPNVLSGQEIYPELLQKAANSENVMRYVHRYLNDSGYYADIHEKIALNKSLMGAPDAIERWAIAIAKLVKK